MMGLVYWVAKLKFCCDSFKRFGCCCAEFASW